MKYSIVLLLVTTQLRAQTTAEEIINQSRERISHLTTIAYTIYQEGYGQKTTADVTIRRQDRTFPIFEMAQLKVAGLSVSDNGSTSFSFASDGVKFEYYDNTNGETVRLDSPSYAKLGRTGQMAYTLLALAPYWQKEPFEALLKNTKKMELTGDTVIYNAPCYKIRFVTEFESEVAGKAVSSAVWFIGKEDLLIHGNIFKAQKQFLRIRDTDKELPDQYFSLAATRQPRIITGMEPISDGLLVAGSSAPDWTLPSPSGPITLSQLKGKVVLLDFWGTWCVPCIRAMPDIQAIHDHFKGRPVEVIGVSVETEKAVDPVAFFKKKGFTYPIVLEGTTITALYKVTIFPSVYLVDKQGRIIHAEYGGNRANFKDDMIAKIEKAITD